MKYLLIGFLLITSVAKAQGRDERAVAAAVERLKQAMISGDSTSLAAIAADGLSYGHSGGNVEDKAAFIHGFTSGKSDFLSIDLTEQTIQVKGNTAIVRHKLQSQNNDAGKPGTVKLAILTVWVKEKSGWKLWARQAVKQPS